MVVLVAALAVPPVVVVLLVVLPAVADVVASAVVAPAAVVVVAVTKQSSSRSCLVYSFVCIFFIVFHISSPHKKTDTCFFLQPQVPRWGAFFFSFDLYGISGGYSVQC